MLRGPATTDSPIRSFTLTLPSRSARVAFTIPPLPGITSGQNVKNRFDLRFSASEAALFKGNKSFAWIQNLEDIIGLRTWEMNRMAAMPCHTFDGVDLTGKTVREAFVIYLQKYGQNPDDYVTDVTFGDFERKKRPGIRIWRWLCKNGGLQWLRDHGYQEWLEKAGIEEG
ncbi:MAG: hypothetical protein LBV12_00770 [Puniceicoccales bacterium]|nr:hypothetical protein [Puniceicoccales bacterium]